MLKNFYKNARKPENNFFGRLMIKAMNKGHEKLANWGSQFLDIKSGDIGIDIGCGGGINIKNQLQIAKKVYGIDYSELSVNKSSELNAEAISEGRCEIFHTNALNIPLEDNSCDYATAFETVYFWTDIVEAFSEVRRILKPGGKFLIVNDISDPKKGEYWINTINLRIYEADELEEILKLAGFKNIDINIEEDSSNIAVVAEK